MSPEFQAFSNKIQAGSDIKPPPSHKLWHPRARTGKHWFHYWFTCSWNSIFPFIKRAAKGRTGTSTLFPIGTLVREAIPVSAKADIEKSAMLVPPAHAHQWGGWPPTTVDRANEQRRRWCETLQVIDGTHYFALFAYWLSRMMLAFTVSPPVSYHHEDNHH